MNVHTLACTNYYFMGIMDHKGSLRIRRIYLFSYFKIVMLIGCNISRNFLGIFSTHILLILVLSSVEYPLEIAWHVLYFFEVFCKCRKS